MQNNTNTSTTSSKNSASTQSNQGSTTPLSPGETTTTNNLEIDISGAWYGTYTTSNSSIGRWAFRVWKTGEKTYRGLLVTTEPYSTSGQAITITITLDGNKITFGGVSVGAVFTGTVNGDEMSGTWKLANNLDGGPWSGQRGVTDITPEETSTIQ